MEMFKKETVFYTEQSTISNEAPMTILTTYQNLTENDPYMLGLTYYTSSVCSHAPTITAWHLTSIYNATARSRKRTWQKIPL